MASHQRIRRILAWVTFARGGVALSLGVSLLLQQEGTAETLATFMGLYWLIGGILTLRFNREIRAVGGRRLPIVAGAFSVLAGSAVLIRPILLQAAPPAEETFLLVGIFILLAGGMNLSSGVRTGTGLSRERSRESTILGMLEIILGAALILSRGTPGAVLITMTTAWAFAAGVILLAQGVRMRRSLGQPQPAASSDA